MTDHPGMDAMAAAFQRFADILERQKQPQSSNNHSLYCFLKRKPTEFHRGFHPDQAYAWIQNLEKIFDSLQCTEAQKVEYAVFMLRKEAENWWMITKANMIAAETELIWENFKVCFLEKYFPDTVRIKKELEFMELRQGNMSIEEYATKFEELCLFYPPFQQPGTEGSRCIKFESGLRPEIKKAFRYQEIRSFPVLVNKCRIYEEDEKDSTGSSSKLDVSSKLQHTNFKKQGKFSRGGSSSRFMELEFMKLRQGNMSIEEYATKFEELCLFYPPFQLPGTEGSKCIKFENGLRPEIKKAIRYQEIRSFPVLVNKCSIYEEDEKAFTGSSSKLDVSLKLQPTNFKKQGKFNRGGSSSRFRGRGTRSGYFVGRPRDDKCFKCGGDHFARDCDKENDVVCYQCNEKGHIRSNCPQIQ